MRFFLVLVGLVAGGAVQAQTFTVTNKTPPRFVVVNRMPAQPACVCGTSCACPAGVCAAQCPVAPSGVVTYAAPPVQFGTCPGGVCQPAPVQRTGWYFGKRLGW